jgi:hypothetical protein
MSSTIPYLPSLGSLLAYGTRSLAEAVAPRPPSAAPVGGNFTSISVTLNNGAGLDIDNVSRLISPYAKTGPRTSLRGIEINNSPTATTQGLSSAGQHPVWLENQGLIENKKGTGVKLAGNQADEVVNAGMIKGSNGMALDMGGGDDLLIVRSSGGFEGAVDGGSGTNQVLLDSAKGGTFDGASQMQHLWVGSGAWTLTGPVPANQKGEVYANATLINKSQIGGEMHIRPGGTYTGGSVGSLNVAGTLLLDPATKSQTRVKDTLHLEQGSTLAFKVGTDEAHSTLKVENRAVLNNATLNIDVTAENDQLLGRQLRVVDAQQVDGQFGTVTSNLKAYTPELIYTRTGAFVAFKPKEAVAA